MDLGGLIAVVSLLGALMGMVWLLFVRGKRLRGLFLLVFCLFIGFPASVIVPELGKTGNAPTTRNSTNELIVVTRKDAAPAASSETTTEPGTETAKEPEQPQVPAAYCNGLAKSDALASEADKKFAEDDDFAKLSWKREQEEIISDAISAEVGLPYEVWSAQANEAGWSHQCDANKRGWVSLGFAGVQAATEEDMRQVSGAVELNLAHRLNKNEGGWFDNDRYALVRCRTKTFDAWPLVGCVMRGHLRNANDFTDPLIFAAARKGEDAVVVPLGTSAIDVMSGEALKDQDGKPISLGLYAGPFPYPELDFEAVKAAFDPKLE